MSADTADPLWVPRPVVPSVCVLCGHTGPGVRMMLIRWREGDPYGSGPRCVDHEGCWSRCLANGDEWPVDDGRPGRAPAPRPVERPSTSGLDRGAVTRSVTPAEEAPGIVPRHSPRNDPPPDVADDDDELDFGEAPA